MDPATTQAVDKVAGLIKASESVSESRLAMLISLMIIICVIVALLELGRLARWWYEIQKKKKTEADTASYPHAGYVNGSGATIGKIEQRVQDIHSNTTECGATQRDTLNFVREFRQDTYKSFDRLSKHIEANTQAVQASTQVLQSLVDRIEFASKTGLETIVK